MTVANKVVYNGNTLIDLTSDTATADDVMEGKTFHLASGAQGVGTLNTAKLGFGYGTCSTKSSGTYGETYNVYITDYEQVEGGIIAVYFPSLDVSAAAFLSVNDNGYRMYCQEGLIKSGVICAGDTAFFMFDGNYYSLLGIDKGTSLILDSELTALETKLGL